MNHRLLAATVAAAAVFAGGPPAGHRGLALAHDVVRRSDPPANGTVRAGPIPIAVVYTGRIDRARSRLVLVAPDGTRRELVLDASAPPNVLRTPVPLELGPGAYVLRWLVLSSDGHITRGDIAFRVVPAAVPGPASDPAR